MFRAFMCKGLETSFNETNNIVIVAVTWISVVNVKSLQQPHVKLGVMPDLRPFLRWHDSFKIRSSSNVRLLEADQDVCLVHKLYHSPTLVVLQDIALFRGNPQDAYASEETGEEGMLMKDKAGYVIGFEKQNFSVVKPELLRVEFETVAA